MSPNKPRTPHRTIRVEDELWDAAVAVAKERGESVSEILRAALKRYVKKNSA